MTTSDRAVIQLLASEIERHLARLGEPRSTNDVRMLLHTLKGSAALAKQHDLSLVVSQLSTRIKHGDADVPRELRLLLEDVLPRLRLGEPAFETEWPEPPTGLKPAQIDPAFRSEYVSAMRDRLAQLDTALEGQDLANAVEVAYRTVHAMKGIAASASDDPTAWYCHGLESYLKPLRGAELIGGQEQSELVRHRAILVQLLEQPDRALHSLRAVASEPPRPSRRLPPGPSLPPSRDADGALRVTVRFIERQLERVERVSLARGEIARTGALGQQACLRLRELQADLLGATRRLVAAPPSSAVLAQLDAISRGLSEVATCTERAARSSRASAEALRLASDAMRNDLTAQRSATMKWAFDRIAQSVENLATDDQEVRVTMAGADLKLDRRLADSLLEPLLQIGRNAVAHGLEPRAERRATGKPDRGTLSLVAARVGDWLRITIEDDGRGVDVAHIRELARRRAALPEDTLAVASETDLLNLLFLPGLTTRDAPDLLAGRGVGLDLAQSAVRRLGGAIRLASRRGSGLRAIVEVPAERAHLDVLWLTTAGLELALPVAFTGRVALAREVAPRVSLAACLDLPTRSTPRLSLELALAGVQPVTIGVDSVGAVEESLIRPVPAMVSARGPYAGAILREDGSLRLVLDGALLAARAWALVA